MILINHAKGATTRAANVSHTGPCISLIEFFPTLAHLQKAITTRPENPVMTCNNSALREDNDSDQPWHGTRTFEEAIRLLRTGDPARARAIEKATARCATAADRGQDRPRIIRDMAGAMPIVPLALVGEPRNMLTRRRNPHTGRVMEIFYNAAAGADETPDNITAAAAKLLAAINAAEARGIRATLHVGAIGTARNQAHGFFVNIKKANAAPNPAIIAHMTTSPALIRRYYMRHLETAPGQLQNTFSYGHGAPAEDARKYVNFPPRAIVLNYYDIKEATTQDIIQRIIGKD